MLGLCKQIFEKYLLRSFARFKMCSLCILDVNPLWNSGFENLVSHPVGFHLFSFFLQMLLSMTQLQLLSFPLLFWAFLSYLQSKMSRWKMRNWSLFSFRSFLVWVSLCRWHQQRPQVGSFECGCLLFLMSFPGKIVHHVLTFLQRSPDSIGAYFWASVFLEIIRSF